MSNRNDKLNRNIHARRRAMALLLAAAGTIAIDAGIAVPAHAQAAGEHRYDIPAGPLAMALNRFAEESGLQLSYDAALTQGRTTPGVQGALSPADALSRLLAGTGLTWRFTGPNAVTLEAAPSAGGVIALDTLRVQGGDLSGTGAGPVRGDESPAALADRPYRTAGSSSYISQEQIQRFRGTSTGDMFKGVPGVISGMNRNGAALNINIRGLAGMDRIKTTIDGSEQTTTSWRGYAGVDDRVYVDPDLIGAITIAKGPTDDAAGTGAIGGSVQIRTLNAEDIVPEGEHFAARVRAGMSDNAISPTAPFVMKPPAFMQTPRTDGSALFDFNNGFGNIAIATRQDSFDIIAAFARRRSGNYMVGQKGTTTYADERGATRALSLVKPGQEAFNTSEDVTSGLVKATFRFGDGHALQLGYSRYENEYGEAQPTMLNSQITWRQTNLSRTNTDTYTARYRWNPGSDWVDLKANLWMSRVDAVLRYNSLPTRDDPIPTLSRLYGGDISNRSVIDTGQGVLTLHYGGTYSHERARSPLSNILEVGVNGDRDLYGLFANGEWKPLGWLTANLGARLDGYHLTDKSDPALFPANWAIRGYNSREGANASISASIVAEPVRGLQFYALHAGGYRPPTIRETGLSVSFLYPNPDLKPETASNWEIGTNFSRDGLLFGKDKARLKLSYFWNNYNDYISRVEMPREMQTIAYFTVVNIDKVRFTGVEASGSYDVDKVFFEGALTYYDSATFCDGANPCGNKMPDGAYTANDIPPRFSASATLGVRLFRDRLELSGRVSRIGSRLVAAQQVLGLNNVGIWVPYTVVDLSGSVKLTREFSLQLSAENLTDRYYIDALNNSALPSPGRTIRAGLTARF
ncbi:TonB-dependent receptor [Sphingomonas sp. dw_22]|uniref:TonB-dependent receptor n=1 Tax=Sphingomonas sp. dw_22 TaxID=2721175 RepID=UPI001BD5AFC0|nr:TonB-dependent receptor [Sphingomonas sp. dw_22]